MEHEYSRADLIRIMLLEIKKAEEIADDFDNIKVAYEEISTRFDVRIEKITDAVRKIEDLGAINLIGVQWRVKINDNKFGEICSKYLSEIDSNAFLIEENLTIQNSITGNNPTWHTDFIWRGKSFVFGSYGQIDFTSPQRVILFRLLTGARGGWVKIQDMEKKTGKDAYYIRISIGQIQTRFTKNLKKHITIPSTLDDDFPNKPPQGAYRIKFTP